MLKTIEYKPIPTDKVDIGPEYSRMRVEEDKFFNESVDELGLIQPIMVFQKGDRYELVVGRRRLETLKKRGEKIVEARIVHPIDEITAKKISLDENRQRRELPFRDTVILCEHFFRKHRKAKNPVKKVADELRMPYDETLKYLRFILLPKEVTNMVEAGDLTQAEAERAALAGSPNKDDTITIAKAIAKGELVPEQTRALPDVSKDNPQATAKEKIVLARKRPIRLIIPVPRSLINALDKAAEDHRMDRKDMAKTALSSWLSRMGYLG